MPAAIETRIFRLHHDAARKRSHRLPWRLSSDWPYNHAVDVLNRTPDIALLKSPRNPCGMLGQITLWRRHDERADAPYVIHQSGAHQAWLANSLMKRERKARLARLDSGSTKSSDHRQHPRTLAHRSRKRGSSTLSSLTPPVRLDDSTFTIMGARDVVFAHEESLYLTGWTFGLSRLSKSGGLTEASMALSANAGTPCTFR